jgi:hypothetical protein
MRFIDPDGMDPAESLGEWNAKESEKDKHRGEVGEAMQVATISNQSHESAAASTEASSENVISSDGGDPEPPGGTIKQYKPGLLETLKKSDSFLGKIVYGGLDALFVTAQLFRDPANKQHLGGGHVNNNEAQRAFIEATSYFVPFGGAEAGAARSAEGTIKYIGRLEDLKNIPRSQTLLDQLPNLGSPRANYYQNMSVLRKTIREGYTIRDASFFRPNTELAPTIFNPHRTIGQTFLGAERLLLKNKGLWP